MDTKGNIYIGVNMSKKELLSFGGAFIGLAIVGTLFADFFLLALFLTGMVFGALGVFKK